jgi:hypothetical protein
MRRIDLPFGGFSVEEEDNVITIRSGVSMGGRRSRINAEIGEISEDVTSGGELACLQDAASAADAAGARIFSYLHTSNGKEPSEVSDGTITVPTRRHPHFS